MARLTLRLPDSLHEALTERAEEEGVSLNQFLVYMLTQAATVDSVRKQREQSDQRRNRFSKEEREDSLRELLKARK